MHGLHVRVLLRCIQWVQTQDTTLSRYAADGSNTCSGQPTLREIAVHCPSKICVGDAGLLPVEDAEGKVSQRDHRHLHKGEEVLFTGRVSAPIGGRNRGRSHFDCRNLTAEPPKFARDR